MLKTSDSIKAISAALFAFQGAVEGVEKNSKNPAFKSRYANLEAVRDTAVPELQKVGVVFLQSAGAIVDGVMAMTTRLIHVESGEWIEGTMDIALGKRDPQGVGSASTYAARYSLMHMLGLPPIDDDGEAAIDRNNSRPATSDVPPTSALSKAQAREPFTALQAELDACTDVDQLNILWRSPAFQGDYVKLPPDWQGMLIDHAKKLKDDMQGPATGSPFVAPNFDTRPQ